jgi:hypothetical protein
MKPEKRGLRRWRTTGVLALGLVIGVVLLAPPAGAHFLPSISHIWRHIKPMADKRYANAVPHTDKAKNAAALNGRNVLGLVHTTEAGNLSGDCTYLDNAKLNGNPSALISVMQEYTGARLNVPLGLFYDTGLQQWCVFTQDDSNMPTGMSFRVVAVIPPGTGGAPRTIAPSNRADVPGR